MLKALFVKVNGASPPTIHNLPRLASESNMPLSEEDIEFLNELLRFNIEARYPKDGRRFAERAQPNTPGT
jgi:HEPN domain-containing protein